MSVSWVIIGVDIRASAETFEMFLLPIGVAIETVFLLCAILFIPLRRRVRSKMSTLLLTIITLGILTILTTVAMCAHLVLSDELKAKSCGPSNIKTLRIVQMSGAVVLILVCVAMFLFISKIIFAIYLSSQRHEGTSPLLSNHHNSNWAPRVDRKKVRQSVPRSNEGSISVMG